jgi:HK97 family phage major capsid protein
MTTKELREQLKAARDNIKAHKEKRLAASNGSARPDGFAAQEKAAVARFGVKTLNKLIKINTSDRRYKGLPEEDRQAVSNLKEAVDVTLMCAHIFKKAPQNVAAYDEMIVPALKAFGIEVGEVGREWIPTVVSDSYVEEYNLERRVAGLFTELKMPSNPYDYPVMSNGFIASRLGENTQKGTKDQFSSSKITLTAQKLSNQAELPEELNEDSAVDVMKVIRKELIEGQDKAMEIAILEGDADGTHQHSFSQITGLAIAADSCETVFDGLRKRALAANLKVDGGAQPVNEEKLSELRKKMGKFGVHPSELALIAGVRGHQDLLQLDDVRTLEQYGPQATVLSGEIAKYEGYPVIVSEYLREDTDTTGVNGATPANNIKASMVLVNLKRFFTGLRRAIQVKVEANRTAFDAWDMVSFSRRAFDGVLKKDGSNGNVEKSVALLYNLA